ncbi:hypothetical protein, partial [Mycobacterium helveticum]
QRAATINQITENKIITSRLKNQGQTDRVGQHPRDHVAGVPDHIVAADLNSNVFRPIRSILHLIGALPPWIPEP